MPFDNPPKDAIMPHPFKEHESRRNLAYVFDYQSGPFKNPYQEGALRNK